MGPRLHRRRAAAPAGADPHRPLFANREDDIPKREERPGFDDVKQPMATIGVDGRFRELNQAFSDLVGYTEPEFQQAVWPPVMDRANLDKHRQQMKDLLEGRASQPRSTPGTSTLRVCSCRSWASSRSFAKAASRTTSCSKRAE